MGIAFIVDGQMEKRIVQRLCKDATVKVTSLNGRSVQINRMIEVIASFLKLMKDRCFPVVILVDREGRDISSAEIERHIRDGLKKLGYDERNLIVSSPDRMIENWIIAGNPRCDQSTDLFSPAIQDCDGRNGKTEVKRSLRARNLSYSETGNGVDLFCSMDFERVSSNSESFYRFYANIQGYCPRLRR
jgi:hypothetical protein